MCTMAHMFRELRDRSLAHASRLCFIFRLPYRRHVLKVQQCLGTNSCRILNTAADRNYIRGVGRSAGGGRGWRCRWNGQIALADHAASILEDANILRNDVCLQCVHSTIIHTGERAVLKHTRYTRAQVSWLLTHCTITSLYEYDTLLRSEIGDFVGTHICTLNVINRLLVFFFCGRYRNRLLTFSGIGWETMAGKHPRSFRIGNKPPVVTQAVNAVSRHGQAQNSMHSGQIVFVTAVR